MMEMGTGAIHMSWITVSTACINSNVSHDAQVRVLYTIMVNSPGVLKDSLILENSSLGVSFKNKVFYNLLIKSGSTYGQPCGEHVLYIQH